MEKKITPIEMHLGAVEEAIDHIAYIRRMAEEEGHDMDKFDAEMNRLCDAYHEKYAKMDKVQLMLHGLAEILKSDHSDEVIEKLGSAFKE
jgi:hypothetical protein